MPGYRFDDTISRLFGERIDDFGAWQEHLSRERARYDRRWVFQRALADLDPHDLWNGWCPLCERAVRFGVSAHGPDVNLREDLRCPGCGTNARARAGLMLAAAAVRQPDAPIYITEQASPNFVWLQARFPGAVGSEFFDAKAVDGLAQYLRDLGGHGAMRREDVTQLTFPDASIDVIASFDVLEHVPNYRAALREFARVLRPGGRLVLTAPFLALQEASVERARIGADGVVEHLLPPEYHGDPLGDGILCFHHFGWELADRAREAGFTEAGFLQPWSPGYGLMGSLWILVCTR